MLNEVIKGLKSRNINGYFAENKKEALEIALSLMEKGKTVGWGGSMSVREIGLYDEILKGDFITFNRDTCETAEQKREMELKTLGADYFLCSCNAVTKDGILINIDGFANRVAAIAYGPKKVIMIVGINKICEDFDSALLRARQTAAVRNAQRFPINTPCKKMGNCADCKSPDTICCQFLATRFSRDKDRMHLILVNEDLGF
ncbi:MAG: lactate utilization protein [Ruminococcaceae bacterium]|nr:lactate utilization protein [Oscillospiraceae bacterium]